MAELDFKLLEFNKCRLQRGKEALRVEVLEDSECLGWLWMSIKDLKANIKENGAHPELLRGLECYRQRCLVEQVSEKV